MLNKHLITFSLSVNAEISCFCLSNLEVSLLIVSVFSFKSLSKHLLCFVFSNNRSLRTLIFSLT